MSASTSALQQKNAKHLIQSFSDLSYIKNPESTHIISRADGVYIYDNDGKKILDSMSGFGASIWVMGSNQLLRQ